MNPERKKVNIEEGKEKEIKDYIDRKIEAEFSVIDRKLKNSFQAIKQDLYSLKYNSGLGISGKNKEIQEVFDEKISNLKRELEEKVEELKKIEIQSKIPVKKKITPKKSSKRKTTSKITSKSKQKKSTTRSKKSKNSKPAKELSRVYEMMQRQLENRMSDLKTKEALLSKQEKKLDSELNKKGSF